MWHDVSKFPERYSTLKCRLYIYRCTYNRHFNFEFLLWISPLGDGKIVQKNICLQFLLSPRGHSKLLFIRQWHQHSTLRSHNFYESLCLCYYWLWQIHFVELMPLFLLLDRRLQHCGDSKFVSWLWQWISPCLLGLDPQTISLAHYHNQTPYKFSSIYFIYLEGNSYHIMGRLKEDVLWKLNIFTIFFVIKVIILFTENFFKSPFIR